MTVDSSFDEIYEELFPIIYRFVRFRVAESEIEDITVETLTKIWKALPGFKGESSLKSWALRIAYHQIADYYRSRKSVPWVSLSDLEFNQAGTDHSEDWTELLSVKQTLSQLPAQQLTAIQLRLVEGFSAAEVGKILGISPKAVDSLLYRAKKSFRKLYEMEHKGGKRI